MSRPYLKPLQPPGCTLTRKTALVPGTPSASMNCITSVAATGVTTMARVGSCIVLIYQTSSLLRRGREASTPAATYGRNIAREKACYKKLTAGGTIR